MLDGTDVVVCTEMIRKQINTVWAKCTGCPTRYRTRHFFNNSSTNEDIATKFEKEYVRSVRNVTTS